MVVREWVRILKTNIYEIGYNIVDVTHAKVQKDETKTKPYVTSLMARIPPFIVKNNKGSDYQLIVLYIESFDTVLECKNYAEDQWNNRKDKEWYKEFEAALREYVKPELLNN